MKTSNTRPVAKAGSDVPSVTQLRNPFPKSDPIGKLTVTRPWQVDLLKKVKNLQKAIGSR